MNISGKSKKEYLKAYYEKNKEALLQKQRVRNKINHQQNRERDNLKNAIWKKNNPERSKELQANFHQTEKWKTYRKKHYMENNEINKTQTRVNKLKRLYGITVDQYDEMHKAQNGKCKICGRTSKEASANRKGDLVIDHCHATKKVRGLLCHHCNAALGQFQDSVELLNIAIQYLSVK